MSNDSNEDFVEYVTARLARLHRAAYLICGDPHLADDLVQASLVSLYARWRQACSAENLDGYVHRIMARRFIDEKRSRWSRVLLRDEMPDMAGLGGVREQQSAAAGSGRLGDRDGFDGAAGLSERLHVLGRLTADVSRRHGGVHFDFLRHPMTSDDLLSADGPHINRRATRSS